ncbi:MAG TPA: hypothetical protein ENK18_27535 [Deltaproteobacteria bacterium]|nr:hypothetical protein [Deltaproteobacteria bacterium]
MSTNTQYVPFAVALVVGLSGFALDDWSLMAWLLAAAIACGGVILVETRWGILATSVLGLGCSSYLFTRKLESASGPALCNVNDVINCDVVNGSAASELLGIPIALLGAGFFLGLAISALIAKEASARLFSTSAALSGVGCLYSLYLAFESKQLGAVCVMCITIYLCCGLLLWAGIRGIHQSGGSFAAEFPKIPGSTSFVTTSAVLVIVVLLGHTTWSSTVKRGPQLPEITGTAPDPVTPSPEPQEHTHPEPSSSLDPSTMAQLGQAYTYARGPVALSGSEPVLGDPNAPYMIVEFADFGCPHCAEAAIQLKQLVKQVPEIQVRFRPFALSGACNPALKGTEGVERCRAAMASECAKHQGKFWEFSSRVFANQRDLSDRSLVDSAQAVGLDLAAFQGCMQEEATVRSVAEHAVAGARAGVMGTPALFLKGVQEDRWLDVCWGPEAVLALVELHRSGEPLPTPTQQSCYQP